MRFTAATFIALGSIFAGLAHADVYVDSYYRSDGTHVQGHHRSEPNSTVTDNFSYKGNTNPYTGETGSNYYRDDPSSGYYGTQPDRDSDGFGW